MHPHLGREQQLTAAARIGAPPTPGFGGGCKEKVVRNQSWNWRDDPGRKLRRDIIILVGTFPSL